LASGTPLIKFLALLNRNKNFRTSVHVTSDEIGMNEPERLKEALYFVYASGKYLVRNIIVRLTLTGI